jgi:FMN phosphatase YigB (HAD superfamily)
MRGAVNDLIAIEKELSAKSVMYKRGELKLVIISDFDDTLFDVTKSIHMATEEIKGRRMSKYAVHELPQAERAVIYTKAYTKYDHTLKPNTTLIDFYRTMYDLGAHIIVVSARRENLRAKTEAKLKKHGIKFKEVILRPERGRATNVSLEEWKARRVGDIMKKYNAALLFDDMRYIIDHIKEKRKRIAVRYFLVKYPNEITEIK